MARIRAKSVNNAKRTNLKPKEQSDDLCAIICYYYPHYSLAEARRLPYRDVKRLLKTVRKEQASHFYTLTQIATAPYTGHRKGLKKLSDQFKKVMQE